MAATYYAQILTTWDWDGIRSDAENASADEINDGVASVYLGSVFSIMPSGKFYMPWTSNQTASDERRDAAYMAALERAADKFGGWIESGEGDPCDLYFAMSRAESTEDTEDTEDC